MTSPADTIRQALYGLPPDPAKRPEKSGLLQAFDDMWTGVSASLNGAIVKDNLTALLTVTAAPTDQMAWVIGDGTPARNGIYANTGTAIAAVWTRMTDLPVFMIAMTDIGGGTSSTFIATSTLPAPATAGRALFVLTPFRNNVGATTLALNGASARPIVTASGSPLANNYLAAGVSVLMLDDGTHFRLISDVASAAIQAAAEAARDDLETLYLGAHTSDPTTDNAGGTLRDGALYWNTTSKVFRAWSTGSGVWRSTFYTYRGAWSSATAYAISDLVGSGGSIFAAKLANTNVTPVDGATWALWLPGVSVADGAVTRAKFAAVGAALDITPTEFGADPAAGSDSLAYFQSAHDAAITAKQAPRILGGRFRVGGDIAKVPGSPHFRADSAGYTEDQNNVDISSKEVLSYVPFVPTQTDTVIMDGTTPDLYNHVPWLAQGLRAISASFDRLWCAWNGNPSSDLESSAGKLCYLKTSDDNGANWSTLMAAWTDSAYCNNPITPGDQCIQPEIIKVGTEMWCFWSNTSTAGGFDSLIWSRLTTVAGKWTNYRYREDTTTGAVSWSSTDINGAPAAGFRLTHPLDGHQLLPLAMDVRLLGTGRVVLLTTGLEGAYGTGQFRNLVYTCALDGTGWQFESAVPLGDYWNNEQWELTITEDAAGLYVLTQRKLITGAAINPGERINVSVSHDLKTWSSPREADTDYTTIRPFAEKLSPRRWAALSPIGSLRERVSLGLSGDGRSFTFGHPISIETINVGLPAYSMLLRGIGCIFIVYSLGSTAKPHTDPLDIRFARLDIRTREDQLYVMRSDRGAAQFNNTSSVSSFSGTKLILPPRAAAALETRGQRYAVTLRWHVTVNPTATQDYKIANVGNNRVNARLSLLYSSLGMCLQVNGRTIRIIQDATEYQQSQIIVDTEEGWCEIEGQHVDLKNDIRLYLGDAYSESVADQAGNVEFDTAAMSLQILARRTQAVAAVVRQTGPNLCLNPGMYINDAGPFALMPDGWFRLLGGGSQVTQQEVFTQADANALFMGWGFGVSMETTVVGAGFGRIYTQWDEVDFKAGRVMTVAFDAYDANGLSYDLFTEWEQNFGSGGSSAVDTPIYHDQIGPKPRRYSHTFTIPQIVPGVTIGTLPTAALRWRVPTTVLSKLVIARVDIYEGAYQRDWMPPDVFADAVALQRQFRRYRGGDAGSPFFGGGIASSPTSARFTMRYDRMRKAPTLATVGAFEVFGTAGAIAVTNLTLANATENSANLIATVGSGLTTGQVLQLRAANDVTAEIRLSAR